MKAQYHTLSVSRIRADTERAKVVTFDLPEQLKPLYQFTQGQYLTLEKNFDGETIRRSYSICSGVGDLLRIGVKWIQGGIFSTYINRSLKIGDQLKVATPQGDFNTQLDAEQQKNYLFIAAGSGITPILSLLKTSLAKEPHSRATLIYGNQSTSSMMFMNDLSFIKNRYLERMDWINIFSRQAQYSDLFNGRIDNRKGAELNKKLIRLKAFDEFFLCGPESMLSEVSRGLIGLGIQDKHIHYELFASSVEDARLAIERHHERSLKRAGKTSDISVRYGGREYRFELSQDGENILDSGLKNGADLPYSCKGGICSTCKCRLLEGQVEMDVNHGLQKEEIDKGYILSCQAHPVTNRVKLDFDQME